MNDKGIWQDWASMNVADALLAFACKTEGVREGSSKDFHKYSRGKGRPQYRS